VRKNRLYFVVFAAVMAFAFSCGMPTLPKEVMIKANPAVSVPLGRVNYNLYSGFSGGNMSGKKGSLNDMFPSWLEDLRDSGATLYDYRPSGVEDDGTQKFLVHYNLDLEGDLGGLNEFDLSEYQDMIDELTGKPTEIGAVSFAIPSMKVEEPFAVEIPLGEVAKQIASNTAALQIDRAYLPVANGRRTYVFPQDVSRFPENSAKDFSITLQGLESLTLQQGKLNFDFTLTYGQLASNPPLGPGSRLVLSGFSLRGTDGKSITAPTGSPVTLGADGATGRFSLILDGVELPKIFALVCNIEITGNGIGYFELDIDPEFESFVISGARELELNADQLASLSYNFPETTHSIGGGLGPSFRAIVETGNLEIDISTLFPPLDSAPPNAEGWNLALNMSALHIHQESLANAAGLSLGGPGQPLRPGTNDLSGKTLNYNPVVISGAVTASIAGGGNKLTFRNIPGGIPSAGGVYEKQVAVRMEVSLLREVAVLAEDFGLDKVNQEIEQELGDDFTAFKPWLNYIRFREGGLALTLEIEKLHIVGGLGLFIDAPSFGLNNAFQPLVSGENATLIFASEKTELREDDLPDKGEPLRVTVKLGLQNPAAQKIYEETKVLTITNVVPGDEIALENAAARLRFDWTALSLKPQPHENGDDDPLPTYPFTGTFPDKDEDGIDLSSLPKGLGFYIPEEGEEAGAGVNAQLYISLKRQSFIDGEWVDDPDGPGDDGAASDGWSKNLQVDLPNLDFHVIYGNGVSDNLFTYEPGAYKGTGAWALPRAIGEILEDPALALVAEDAENADNPFKLYTASSLPEQDKAIPLGNFAKTLNETLSGRKEGPLFFSYTVALAGVPGGEGGAEEPGEIVLYPDMLKKKIVASADLLMIVPLVLQADRDAKEDIVVVTINPDLGDEDLFRREGPDDNEYFDMVSSFGFDIILKNVAGLNAGKLFLENKTDVKKLKYRLPIVDFTDLRGALFLDSAEIEKIKAIWPFIPQASIEFERGEILRIERNFNIGLQSITVKLGGEYTFETGL
jgi:hypothetical protein